MFQGFSPSNLSTSLCMLRNFCEFALEFVFFDVQLHQIVFNIWKLDAFIDCGYMSLVLASVLTVTVASTSCSSPKRTLECCLSLQKYISWSLELSLMSLHGCLLLERFSLFLLILIKAHLCFWSIRCSLRRWILLILSAFPLEFFRIITSCGPRWESNLGFFLMFGARPLLLILLGGPCFSWFSLGWLILDTWPLQHGGRFLNCLPAFLVLSKVWIVLLTGPREHGFLVCMQDCLSPFGSKLLVGTLILELVGRMVRFRLPLLDALANYLRLIFVICPILSLLFLKLRNKGVSLGHLLFQIFSFCFSMIFFFHGDQ